MLAAVLVLALAIPPLAIGASFDAPGGVAVGEPVSVHVARLRPGFVYRLSFVPSVAAKRRGVQCARNIFSSLRVTGSGTYTWSGRVPSTLRCSGPAVGALARTIPVRLGMYRWVVGRKTGRASWDRRASLLTRSVDVRSAVAPGASCRLRRIDEVVAVSSRAVIWLRERDDAEGNTLQRFVACWKPTGRQTLLASGGGEPLANPSTVGQVRLGGRFAAYFITVANRDQGPARGQIEELDLRTGRTSLFVDRPVSETFLYGFAPDFLSIDHRHGFLAWRAVQSTNPYDEHTVIAVHDSQGTREVDDSDPGDGFLTAPLFSPVGSTVLRWLRNGQERSVTLR